MMSVGEMLGTVAVLMSIAVILAIVATYAVCWIDSKFKERRRSVATRFILGELMPEIRNMIEDSIDRTFTRYRECQVEREYHWKCDELDDPREEDEA